MPGDLCPGENHEGRQLELGTEWKVSRTFILISS
jgi:hypothetical protein